MTTLVRFILATLGALMLLYPRPSSADEFGTYTTDSFATDACCDTCGYDACGCGGPAWQIGFDFVFAKPHFERNLAFTAVEANGISFASITDTEFDYDFELSPRIWAHYESTAGVGVRGIYWQFDHTSAIAATQPSANGFGLITHPQFGDANLPGAGVNISSPIPTDTFAARSGVDAYTLDLEVTKRGDFGNWQLLAAGGVRYARIAQGYQAELRDAALDLVGAIDFQHVVEGFGPTLALESRRQLGGSITGFASSRFSVLMGDSGATLIAGEDLDLLVPFFTAETRGRDDVLPIAETQIGAMWSSQDYGFGQLFARGAFEAQWWGGVGNASSEDGDLGFLGFTAGIGVAR